MGLESLENSSEQLCLKFGHRRNYQCVLVKIKKHFNITNHDYLNSIDKVWTLKHKNHRSAPSYFTCIVQDPLPSSNDGTMADYS